MTAEAVKKKTDRTRAIEGSADESRSDGITGDDETGGNNSVGVFKKVLADMPYSCRTRTGQRLVKSEPSG